MSFAIIKRGVSPILGRIPLKVLRKGLIGQTDVTMERTTANARSTSYLRSFHRCPFASMAVKVRMTAIRIQKFLFIVRAEILIKDKNK